MTALPYGYDGSASPRKLTDVSLNGNAVSEPTRPLLSPGGDEELAAMCGLMPSVDGAGSGRVPDADVRAGVENEPGRTREHSTCERIATS